jgi:hypothetical protein
LFAIKNKTPGDQTGTNIFNTNQMTFEGRLVQTFTGVWDKLSSWIYELKS